MVGKIFGNLLKQIREARGYSMNQLAEKTYIDVAHISRLESGKRSAPKPETIAKLASILGNYEELMAAAGYLTPNKGKIWDGIKKQVIDKDRDSYINKAAEKMSQQLHVDPLEAKKKIIHALDNFDKLSIESQIELISSLVPYHEYDEQGNALVVRAFPPSKNGIKESSSQYMRPVSCGERIALIRDGLGMSQKDLAEKAGISLSKLIEYEEDKTFPNAGDIKAIADTMGFEPSFFLLSAEETVEVDEQGYKNHIVKWKHKGYAPEDIDKILEKWEAIVKITNMSNNGEI